MHLIILCRTPAPHWTEHSDLLTSFHLMIKYKHKVRKHNFQNFTFQLKPRTVKGNQIIYSQRFQEKIRNRTYFNWQCSLHFLTLWELGFSRRAQWLSLTISWSDKRTQIGFKMLIPLQSREHSEKCVANFHVYNFDWESGTV